MERITADTSGSGPTGRRLFNSQATRERLGGISHDKLVNLIADQELMPTMIGKRIYVSDVEIERFIDAHTLAPSSGPAT